MSRREDSDSFDFRTFSRMMRPTVPSRLETPAMTRRWGFTRAWYQAGSGGTMVAGAAASSVPTPSSAVGRPPLSSTMGLSSRRVTPSRSRPSTARQRPWRKASSFASSVSASVPRCRPSQVRPSQWAPRSARACSGVVRAMGQIRGGAMVAQASAWRPPMPKTTSQPASGSRLRETSASVGRPDSFLKATFSQTRPPIQGCSDTRCFMAAASAFRASTSKLPKCTAPRSDLCQSWSAMPLSTMGSPTSKGRLSDSMNPCRGTRRPAAASRP